MYTNIYYMLEHKKAHRHFCQRWVDEFVEIFFQSLFLSRIIGMSSLCSRVMILWNYFVLFTSVHRRFIADKMGEKHNVRWTAWIFTFLVVVSTLLFFTARIRRMGKVMFSVCSHPGEGGCTPVSGSISLLGEGYPSPGQGVSQSWSWCPPPPPPHPGTGYAAGGMPRAVSRRSAFFFVLQMRTRTFMCILIHLKFCWRHLFISLMNLEGIAKLNSNHFKQEN